VDVDVIQIDKIDDDDLTFSIIQRLTPKSSLINLSILSTGKRHSVRLKFKYGPWCFSKNNDSDEDDNDDRCDDDVDDDDRHV
jgi:hypothetical protein